MSLNNIKVRPTGFVGHDNNNQPLFVLEGMGEFSVNLTIDQAFDLKAWNETAQVISDCVDKMTKRDNQL